MNDDTSILDHGDTRVLAGARGGHDSPDNHDAHEAPTQVRDYVGAVRRCLADLEPEELDDLTSGMHADLAELLAERGGSLEAILGSPARYAAELRSAAGLPESPSRRSRLPGVATLRQDARDALARVRSRWPWLDVTWAFVVTLRPAWWVLRGLALAVMLRSFLTDELDRQLLPGKAVDWVGAGLMVLASVWWARRSLRAAPARPSRPARLLTLAANVVAVIAVLTTMPGSVHHNDVVVAQYNPNGLFLDGSEIQNIYAYDADGKRLSDIRLFSDRGTPIAPFAVDAVGTELVARLDRYGAPWANVFPRPWRAELPPWVFTASPQGPSAPEWMPPLLISPLAPVPPTMPPTTPSTSSPTPSASTTSTPSTPPSSTATPSKPTPSKPTPSQPASSKALTSTPAPPTATTPGAISGGTTSPR